MPATWSQEYNFYIVTHGGIPFLRSIDMEAIEHVPLVSHPRHLIVRVRMLHPREDGLRSVEETDALYVVEEQLQAGLGGKYDAIYWGKTVGDGWTYFNFQVPADPEFTRIPVPDQEAVATYPFETAASDDPEWQRYKDAYPNAFQQQQMWNRELQATLEEQGDALHKRRRIDHVALFPTQEQMRQARRELRQAHFRIDSEFRTDGPDDDLRYGLEFHRTDACEGFRPDEVTAEILDCIEPSDGIYNGWGTFAKASARTREKSPA